LGQNVPPIHLRRTPLRNLSALQHGFYVRRIKKRDLDVVDATYLKCLVEGIACIRILIYRLMASVQPDMGPFELALILRALSLPSSTITRLAKTQFLIAESSVAMDDLIGQAILEIDQELRSKLHPSEESASSCAPDPHAISTEVNCFDL
jgi:hypothetical protein